MTTELFVHLPTAVLHQCNCCKQEVVTICEVTDTESGYSSMCCLDCLPPDTKSAKFVVVTLPTIEKLTVPSQNETKPPEGDSQIGQEVDAIDIHAPIIEAAPEEPTEEAAPAEAVQVETSESHPTAQE